VVAFTVKGDGLIRGIAFTASLSSVSV